MSSDQWTDWDDERLTNELTARDRNHILPEPVYWMVRYRNNPRYHQMIDAAIHCITPDKAA